MIGIVLAGVLVVSVAGFVAAPLFAGTSASAPTGTHFPATPSHYTHPLVLATGSAATSGTSAGPLGCPLPSDQCYYSYNWAGYAVVTGPDTVTAVSASWRVPAIAGATSTTCPDAQMTWDSNSVWVGIDGAVTPTVEQTGTSSDCFYGQTSYYAWYEFYPAGSAPIPYNVNAGDQMTASVQYLYTNASGVPVFQTTLIDETAHWTFTNQTAVPGAEMTSAEWIDESPYYNGFLGLTHVSRVFFTDASATINGISAPIAHWGTNVWWILSVDYNFPYVSPLSLTYAKAQPQALFFRGSGFGVNWIADGP